MKQIRDVVIVGAGIAGSCLAKMMADCGWDTVLIDRQSFPRHKVCGEFLSPESRRILHAAGLKEAVQALQPSRIKSARLMLPRSEGIEVELPGAALGVSRFALDQALHEAAVRSGAEVRTGTAVLSLSASEEPCCTVLQTRCGGSTEALRARAVIGAWGTNPRLAPSAAASGERRKSRRVPRQPIYVGVKSHFTGLDSGQAVELYFFPGGYIGISPVEGGEVNVCALLRQEAVQDDGADRSVLGLLRQAAQRHPELRGRLASAVPVPGTQAAVAPVLLSGRPAPWGDCAHVGDAALMIPPLCGDGMTMALRSAQLCAGLADGFLRGELTESQWRERYTQAIVREFSGPLRWGRFLHRLGDLPVLPRLLMELARLSPQLAAGLVQATRLKESGL